MKMSLSMLCFATTRLIINQFSAARRQEEKLEREEESGRSVRRETENDEGPSVKCQRKPTNRDLFAFVHLARTR